MLCVFIIFPMESFSWIIFSVREIRKRGKARKNINILLVKLQICINPVPLATLLAKCCPVKPPPNVPKLPFPIVPLPISVQGGLAVYGKPVPVSKKPPPEEKPPPEVKCPPADATEVGTLSPNGRKILESQTSKRFV